MTAYSCQNQKKRVGTPKEVLYNRNMKFKIIIVFQKINKYKKKTITGCKNYNSF